MMVFEIKKGDEELGELICSHIPTVGAVLVLGERWKIIGVELTPQKSDEGWEFREFYTAGVILVEHLSD